MGLDQYLDAQLYYPTADFYPREKTAAAQKILEVTGLTELPQHHGYGGIVLSVQAAYWRKANQIHSWFVREVQDGVDDCRAYDVDRGQLRELRDICAAILATAVTHTELRVSEYDPKKTWEATVLDSIDRALVKEHLEPQGGFFFGSTDIDGYYVDDLRDTVRQLNAVLSYPGFQNADFQYRASW